MSAEELLAACGPGTRDEGERALVAADGYLVKNELELAASALDRAYGLLPRDEAIAGQRAALLDDLSIREHGLVWRYVPAGSFLMGSLGGDPDERPIHPRRLAAFWITDIPITWAAYCALLGWQPPPDGFPPDDDPSFREETPRRHHTFVLHELGKIRRQYCETGSPAAGDWHSHFDDGKKRPLAFDAKPLVAASAYDAEELAAALTRASADAAYGLPTEAEWEKAARGGLIGARWSWGDTPPKPQSCDFNRFGAFHLEDPRRFPVNGYGLHSMCGGVAEWTADRYDALAYDRTVRGLPPEASTEEVPYPEPRVLRGGSWADCAEAVTVSFRTSRAQGSWRADGHARNWGMPTVGFRLVRRRR